MPDGFAGIAFTLNRMVALTKEYRVNLTIRRLAESIVQLIPGKSYTEEAMAVQDWVRGNIRYTQDVWDVETLKTPLALIVDRFGDCDDMTLLAGTLLQTLGHPVRYVAVGCSDPNAYEHVYLETRIGTRWTGMELTENVPLGWCPQPQLIRMVRNV